MNRRYFDSPRIQEAWEQIRNDYDAAKQSRFQRRRAGVSGVGRTGDYHYASERDYFQMMETSRDIARNDCIVGQGIERCLDNIIRDGFAVDPKTGDTGADQALWARWQTWGKDPEQCDAAGEFDFHTMEEMVLRAVIVDGDILNLPLRDGQLRQVEAHRCKTPTNTTKNVVHGVLLDEARRRLEYWLTKDEISASGSVAKVSDITAYPARQKDPRTGETYRSVFHCYRPRRISQTRGVTMLAPVSNLTGMHDDLQFAQLVKAQVQACFAILEETPLAVPGGRPVRTGEEETEYLSDGGSRILGGVSPGMRVSSKPGGKLTGFTPTVPGADFFPHSMLILSFIAVNLGLPVQLLLLDPKQTNFSGWRGAIDQARMGFRRFQQWLATYFHRPVYSWKVRQWLAEDSGLRRLHEAGTIDAYGHEWNYPRWPYIEPATDAAADSFRVKNLQTSPRRAASERGVDLETIVDESVADNAYAIRAAKRMAATLNQEFPADPEPVTWRDVLTLPTPDRISVSGLIGGSSQNTGAANADSTSQA